MGVVMAAIGVMDMSWGGRGDGRHWHDLVAQDLDLASHTLGRRGVRRERDRQPLGHQVHLDLRDTGQAFDGPGHLGDA